MTLPWSAPPEFGQAPRRLRLLAPERPAGRDFVRVSFGLVNRMVMLADACVVLAAAVVAAPGQALWQDLILGMATSAVVATSVRLWGGYRVERYLKLRAQAFDIAVGWGLAALLGQVVLAGQGTAAWPLAILAALAAGRAASAAAFLTMRRMGLLRRRVAVIGGTALGDEVIERLRDSGEFSFRGLFDERSSRRAGHLTRLSGGLEDLRRLARRSGVDLIVVAIPWTELSRILELGEQVQSISADVVAPLENPGFLAGSSLLTSVAGMPALQLTHHPFKGSEGVVKVVQDYLVALAALVVTSPVMIAAAIAVWMDDDGPVLFRQKRVGFNGRTFEILKFRSMSVDPDDDGAAVRPPAHRLTRIGAFLRRTSIDELPQLFNVLRGEMSIVGPRPHVPNMLVGEGRYADTVRTYAARHRIKPGITGWAQINGMRGGIGSPEKAQRGVDLDLYYIRNWSLQLDLRIMVQTVLRHMID